MDDFIASMVIMLLLLIGGATGFFIGINVGETLLQNTAIEHGVAAYVCDAHGECEFKWKGEE